MLRDTKTEIGSVRTAASFAAALRAPHHLLHHVPHLLKILQKRVHFLNRGAAALGDPTATRPVDDLGVDPLAQGHRPDDRLDGGEVVVADLGVLHLLGDPGEHPHDPAEGAHLLDLLELVEEVVEGESALEDAGGGLFGLLGLEDLLGLLDQGEHVAHAQDPAGQAVGVEEVEVLDLLPGGGEGDRSADHLLHAQGRAPAGVTVELGEDDPVELEGLVTSGRLNDSMARQVWEGVLAGEGTPTQVADARGLELVQDTGALEAAVDAVIAANPDVVENALLEGKIDFVAMTRPLTADPELLVPLVRHAGAVFARPAAASR